MNLDGIDFGRLWNSSGARGFFGDQDEYWYHKYWRRLGLDYDGYTFVAKTSTTFPRVGNMPLDARWRPRERRPRCIVVKPAAGVVLNAVGLSGPGIVAMLRTNKWQLRKQPTVLSYMPTTLTHLQTLAEDAAIFGDYLAKELPRFNAPVALQVNFSCPNVDHGGNDPDEVVGVLRALRHVGVTCPLVPKFNALEPVRTAVEVAESPFCAAVAVGNTIPWGRAAEHIDWRGLFGSDVSPLAHLGGGGLSGSPLLPLTTAWVAAARGLIRKPLVAGGGVLSARDARVVLAAGADVLEVGVVGMLRPWRARGIRDAVSPARVTKT